MKIKAITLHQPFASLVAWGEKTIETRSWSTKHRGLLAIHSAKKILNELMAILITSGDGAVKTTKYSNVLKIEDWKYIDPKLDQLKK